MKVSTVGFQFLNLVEFRLGRISFDPPFSGSTERDGCGRQAQGSHWDVHSGEGLWQRDQTAERPLIKPAGEPLESSDSIGLTYDQRGNLAERAMDPLGKLVDIYI